jgi:hypothetical protein
MIEGFPKEISTRSMVDLKCRKRKGLALFPPQERFRSGKDSVFDEEDVRDHDKSRRDREDGQDDGDEDHGACQDWIFVDEFSHHDRLSFCIVPPGDYEKAV